jgi:hypothetical protein
MCTSFQKTNKPDQLLLTPPLQKTIGMAIHAVFENGSLEGGFYTTVDPIAKMARVLLKVPKDDYDWSLGWVANQEELWQAAATKQMQQRSEVVKKVKHRLHQVYNIRKPKADYHGFLADIAPLQGELSLTLLKKLYRNKIRGGSVSQ